MSKTIRLNDLNTNYLVYANKARENYINQRNANNPKEYMDIYLLFGGQMHYLCTRTMDPILFGILNPGIPVSRLDSALKHSVFTNKNQHYPRWLKKKEEKKVCYLKQIISDYLFYELFENDLEEYYGSRAGVP